MPVSEKIKLIDRNNKILSIREQCALLQLGRSNLYYEKRPEVTDEDMAVMNVIDRIYTKRPYYGVPRITRELRKENLVVNHKRVYRLMKVMGIEAVRPKKNLSKSNITHEVYPYLLENLTICRPNQVWGVDITYVRLKGDFLYLFAVMDWFSRYILAWELSDTMSTGFCCETLRRALKIATPEIHNSDQGSQLTAKEYLEILKSQPGIKISMDHKGRCFDNIFTERLWRTIKYEEVYLKDYSNPREARESLTEYLKFYNDERFHQSLKYKTPAEIYFEKTS